MTVPKTCGDCKFKRPFAQFGCLHPIATKGSTLMVRADAKPPPLCPLRRKEDLPFLRKGAVVPIKSITVGKAGETEGHLKVHGVSNRKDGFWLWGEVFESGEQVSVRLGK